MSQIQSFRMKVLRNDFSVTTRCCSVLIDVSVDWHYNFGLSRCTWEPSFSQDGCPTNTCLQMLEHTKIKHWHMENVISQTLNFLSQYFQQWRINIILIIIINDDIIRSQEILKSNSRLKRNVLLGIIQTSVNSALMPRRVQITNSSWRSSFHSLWGHLWR